MQTFRSLRVEPATRRVWRGTREVHLTRKAFDLLAALIERRPAVVSKDDLRRRLWPDTFVSEVTLHSLVSELRRVLDDDAGDPTFIRTVHGMGYAFVCAPDAASGAGRRRVRGWLVGPAGRLRLFEGDNVLGRGADVVDLPSTTVSRRHAGIRFDADAWLEDLGSKNGTFVGDAPVVGPVRLKDGDRLRFGSCMMTFRVCHAEGTRSTRTHSGAAPGAPREQGRSR